MFWPKIFWDFLTKGLDWTLRPFPLIQLLNLGFSILLIAWEWPIDLFAGTRVHQSLQARLIVVPFAGLVAALIYQGTDVAFYYFIGTGMYYWAHITGEIRLFL
ncbi:hypothetical protein LHYA1_G008586, partial [Lachnellula hyalina]